jgi:NAD(P)-dependent dehydrogenase (short-subunit alcohol dehydrogenase family)
MDGQPLALITGSGHRLGKLFALTMAKRGYAILLHHHNSLKKANNCAVEIRALGVPVYVAQADLTDEADLFTLIKFMDTLPHKVMMLVNSASIMMRNNLLDLSSTEWDTIFALNLRAPFLLSQQVAKRMPEGGMIINISDAGVKKNWTGFPAYIISKSGLETLTRLQARTYAPGIRVNAIAPGLVLRSDETSPQEWEKLVERLPLKKPTSIDDITAALTFLLDNPSITGQTIIVDGGFSLI